MALKKSCSAARDDPPSSAHALLSTCRASATRRRSASDSAVSPITFSIASTTLDLSTS